MNHRVAISLFCALALAVSGRATAQTPTQALANKWNTICATAVNGTQLFVRCSETASSSDPLANLRAAAGQHLEELPAHARVATGDTEVQFGAQHADLGGARVSWRDNPFSGAALQLDGDLAARWSLFASLEGGRLDRRRGPNEAAFDADTSRAAIGVNFQPASRWLLGLTASQDRESLDYRDSDGSARTHYRGLIAMASFNASDAWTFDAYSGRLQGGLDLERSLNYVLPIVGGGEYRISARAFAAPDSSRRLSGIASSWNWARGGWQGDVQLGLDQSSTSIDAYTESGGGGLALDVPSRTVETRRGRVDATLTRALSQDWGVWQPSLRLGWRREFSNAGRRLTLGLAEDTRDNPISFATEDPDRGWGELGLGSVFTFIGGKSAFVEYRQRFAHQFLRERVLALGFRWELH